MGASLEELLRIAAQTADWDREVTHRCAWCQRVRREDGTFHRLAPVSSVRPIMTDGMCDECGTRALVHLERRRAARQRRRAA